MRAGKGAVSGAGEGPGAGNSPLPAGSAGRARPDRFTSSAMTRASSSSSARQLGSALPSSRTPSTSPVSPSSVIIARHRPVDPSRSMCPSIARLARRGAAKASRPSLRSTDADSARGAMHASAPRLRIQASEATPAAPADPHALRSGKRRLRRAARAPPRRRGGGEEEAGAQWGSKRMRSSAEVPGERASSRAFRLASLDSRTVTPSRAPSSATNVSRRSGVFETSPPSPSSVPRLPSPVSRPPSPVSVRVSRARARARSDPDRARARARKTATGDGRTGDDGGRSLPCGDGSIRRERA